jgi:hypothetical protein
MRLAQGVIRERTGAQPLALRPRVGRIDSRLEPRLYETARRFVLDYEAGRLSVEEEMESELYRLLRWLAEQTLKQATEPRAPEEIGREILNYRDDTISRGVAYGALWAALVRVAAIYLRDDALEAQRLQESKAQSRRVEGRAKK